MTDPAAGLVDTHAHVMDPAYSRELDAVLERAREAGVARLLTVGYDLPTSRAAVALARRFPELMRAAVGIHPNSAGEATDADFEELAALAAEPEVAAIGETGLDYYRERTPHARQQEAFAWHLDLAERLDLPAIIHNREADHDVAPALTRSAERRTSSSVPGVLHCYSSEDRGYLQRMLEAGYFVSFAGPLTFKNSGLPTMAALVPLERLLVETDCPYLAPEPVRGRRNEPAYVRHTVERLAEVKAVSFEALRSQLWANSCRVVPAFAPQARGAS